MQYVATQLTKLGSLIMYILGALGFIATTNIRQIATSAIQSLFSNQLLTQEAAFDTASETPKLTPLDMVYSLVKKEQAKYVESRENQWIANFRLGAIKVNHVREMFKQITEFYHAKRPVDKRLEQIENRLKELEGQEELMKSPGDLKSMIQMFLNHIQKVKEISNPRLLMPASREEQETRLGANYSEDLAAIQENYQGSPSRY